jgi:hypothetical protein
MYPNDFGETLVSGLCHRINQRNYNGGNVYISEPVKGDGLVHRSNGQHTLFVRTINFTGNISFEGTLDLNPDCATYVIVPVVNPIDNTSNVQLNFDHRAGTGNSHTFYSLTGQFSWIRANISNIAFGSIDSIKIAF